MSLKYVDEFVIVPEQMYKQLVGRVDEKVQEKPVAKAENDEIDDVSENECVNDEKEPESSEWTAERVVGHLPKRLTGRGRKLLHILQAVLRWDGKGRVIDDDKGSAIEESHIVDLLTHLLAPSEVGPPTGHDYVDGVVRNTHIPTTLLRRRQVTRRRTTPEKPVMDKWLTF